MARAVQRVVVLLRHTLAARGGVLEVKTATSSFIQGEIIL
jgi:hypothetical protein